MPEKCYPKRLERSLTTPLDKQVQCFEPALPYELVSFQFPFTLKIIPASKPRTQL